MNNQHRKPTKKRNPDAVARGARIDVLALAAQSKDSAVARRALATLLERIGPMMRNICATWAKKNGTEYDDVFQDASLGFLRAVEKWRPAKGANFLTYVGPWLHAFARRCEMSHDRTGKTVRAPHRVAANRVSLDGELTTHGELTHGRQKSFHETLLGVEPEQLDFLEALDRRNAVHAAVRALPKPEREIMRMRLDGQTLWQIGEARDRSRERIRQVELQACTRLRKRLSRVLKVA